MGLKNIKYVFMIPEDLSNFLQKLSKESGKSVEDIIVDFMKKQTDHCTTNTGKIMTKLFVYGTLMNPKLQERLLGRFPDQYPAKLSDFRKEDTGHHGYPAIFKDEGHYVIGVVLLLQDDEIPIMERYEGGLYERKKITINPISFEENDGTYGADEKAETYIPIVVP